MAAHSENNKIAVIGGGIAGLTAAYLLQEKYDITLFEKSDRLGGNAYTLTTPGGEEADIAAAVFGKFSNRNLFRLFSKLNIDTVASVNRNPFNASSPGISCCNLDTKRGLFFTPRLKGLIAQHFEVLRPDHVMSVLRLMRGLKRAQAAAARGDLDGLTIEEALQNVPQLQGEAKLMLIGCLCLMTSMHCNDVLDSPARFVMEQLKKYDDLIPPTPKSLLSLSFVQHGTKSYVRALSDPYRESVVLNAKIRAIERQDGMVLVHGEDGRTSLFNKVVFACNADQALALLQKPTPDEKRLLGAWRYSEGAIVVHTDHAQFPRRELMTGFTFLYRDRGRYIDTSVSGSLWALPGVSKKSRLISTQRPNFPITNSSRVFEKVFRTPIFDFQSCSAVRELPFLNGEQNTYYCGSHFGFGLHEDAVTSAVAVARALHVDF